MLSNLRGLWITDDNIFVPTVSGINVFNNDGSLLLNHIGEFDYLEYYSQITFNEYTPKDNFQVKIIIPQGSDIYNYTTISGHDVYFKTLEDEELYFYNEVWNPIGESIFWIKVPVSGTNTVNIFFGNSAYSEYNGENDLNTVLLISSNTTDGSTTFIDEGAGINSTKVIYKVGNVHHEIDQTKFGSSSIYFDGSGDRLWTTHVDFSLGTEDFTIDFWARPVSGGGGNYARYIQIGPNSTNGGLWIYKDTSNPGRLQVAVYYNAYVTVISPSSATEMPNDIWTHVTVVRTNGNSYKLFLNGILKASNTVSTLGNNITQTTISIGSNIRNSESYNGYLDDIRVYKGMVLYTSNFSQPTRKYIMPTGYHKGSGQKVFIFFDDFNGISDRLHLSSQSWSSYPEPDFNVSNSLLRVTSTYYTGDYSYALLNYSTFYFPFVVDIYIPNVVSKGTSNQSFGLYLNSPGDGVYLFPEGSYNRLIKFNDSYFYDPEFDTGFQAVASTFSFYFCQNKLRLKVDRGATSFDKTWIGTTALTARYLRFFENYSAEYYVDWVRIREYNANDIIGYYESYNQHGVGFGDLAVTSNYLWADNTYLYMSTQISGVYRAPLSSIEISSDIYEFLSAPNLTSNVTLALHGAGNYLCITTNSGVDHINLVSEERGYKYINDLSKCFQTSNGGFYYIQEDKLCCVYSTVSGIINPDYIYENELLFVTSINDIYVTENTSTHSGGNVIFLATDNGVHIIEEKRGDEINSRIKRYFID